MVNCGLLYIKYSFNLGDNKGAAAFRKNIFGKRSHLVCYQLDKIVYLVMKATAIWINKLLIHLKQAVW